MLNTRITTSMQKRSVLSFQSLTFCLSLLCYSSGFILPNVLKQNGFSLLFSAKSSLSEIRKAFLDEIDDRSNNKLNNQEVNCLLKLIDESKRTDFEWKALDFCTPNAYEPILSIFNKSRIDFRVQCLGGYSQAVRKRILYQIADDNDESTNVETVPLDMKIFVSAVEVTGNFVLDGATRSDFLQSVLSIPNIDISKLGDVILLGAKGAQIIVVPELVDGICSELKKVLSVSVTCKEIPLTELQVKPPITKQISSVEPSTRLDAMGSAGFGISRSRIASLIEEGEVMVDWRTVRDSAHKLKVGSVIYVAGMGRVVVEDIASTAKGRFKVKMTKFG